MDVFVGHFLENIFLDIFQNVFMSQGRYVLSDLGIGAQSGTAYPRDETQTPDAAAAKQSGAFGRRILMQQQLNIAWR